MEEVTPKKEYQIARLILAVVYFLVSERDINPDSVFASRLAPQRRLYKPPPASCISSISVEGFNLKNEIIAEEIRSASHGAFLFSKADKTVSFV